MKEKERKKERKKEREREKRSEVGVRITRKSLCLSLSFPHIISPSGLIYYRQYVWE